MSNRAALGESLRGGRWIHSLSDKGRVALRWRITEPTTGLPWTRERTCAGGEKHGAAARGAGALRQYRWSGGSETWNQTRDRETEMAATETGEPQRTLTKTTVKRSYMPSSRR